MLTTVTDVRSQKIYALAVRVIYTRISIIGTAMSEPTAHISGSIFGIFDRKLVYI